MKFLTIHVDQYSSEPDSWRPFLAGVCIIFFVCAFGLAWWSDRKAGRHWFTWT
ncbi:hypothetical protein [Acaryochloris thomasi]|uniref:hypothetical protein n=1 Tax=Acaryochloris thomasi TaxID=2929456 RepID=UPI001313E688|nr:hypothetical protein [Acaryochloris thomasi]